MPWFTETCNTHRIIVYLVLNYCVKFGIHIYTHYWWLHSDCLIDIESSVVYCAYEPIKSFQTAHHTCSKCSSNPHTLRVALSRHNEVVDGVSLEVLGEGYGGRSIQGGGGITVDQVGVRWICTIVNSAGVPWLKHTVHKYTCWVPGVNTHTKIVCATCGQRLMTVSFSAWNCSTMDHNRD